MADRAALRRLLLDLIGTVPFDEGQLVRLNAADWEAFDVLAIAQRAKPLLYHQHRENPLVPDYVRERWRDGHRFWSMQAMAQRADIADTVALLRRAGFEPLVMKGGWLAWHCYPHPALRPLRDIDILLPADGVLAGFEALKAAGYAEMEQAELSLDELVRVDKSLPLLRTPRGSAIELHHHIWFPQGWLEWPTPPLDDAGFMARSIVEEDGVRYPCPQDMFKHLVIHAVYSHRLDCGPLLLPDIDLLLRRHPISWAALWPRAEAEGWARGALLVLGLVERWRGTPGLRDVLTARRVPEAVLDGVPDLLMQDMETRKSAALAASVMGGGSLGATLGRVRDRALGRKSATSAGPAATRDFAAEGGFVSWAGSRLHRSLRDLTTREVRQQARHMGRLTRWIDGTEN